MFQAQDVPFSVVLEVGRLGFFAARQGTLFSNVASVWRMENGWVIVSFSNQEVEPTTAGQFSTSSRQIICLHLSVCLSVCLSVSQCIF